MIQMNKESAARTVRHFRWEGVISVAVLISLAGMWWIGKQRSAAAPTVAKAVAQIDTTSANVDTLRDDVSEIKQWIQQRDSTFK